MKAKKETFRVVRHLSKNTVYGTIDKHAHVEMEITVGIHEGGNRGWFEMYDTYTGGDRWYAEGGLWFNGNKLIDYDGVFSLSDDIIKKLNEWGINTNEI